MAAGTTPGIRVGAAVGIRADARRGHRPAPARHLRTAAGGGAEGRAGTAGTADRSTGPRPRCRVETQSVAELAAGADLPVGVVRGLLGDLLESGFVRVRRPVPPARLPDERILREVIDGLRAL
ncbi:MULTISPECIES: DUF742 domain-containing protein [unclassified Streptomyces]|uniref:DUF742 domain-containing protein n=1 Tax=unclassified Streptomyces TaxID=2593676 RepID=UPI00380427DB